MQEGARTTGKEGRERKERERVQDWYQNLIFNMIISLGRVIPNIDTSDPLPRFSRFPSNIITELNLQFCHKILMEQFCRI